MRTVLNYLLSFAFIVLSSTLLTSCQAIGDIFSAGFYVGIFVVVAIVIVAIVVIGKLRGGSK